MIERSSTIVLVLASRTDASRGARDELRRRMHCHHLSGGAQGPDPVQALLQAGPPDAVQPPPAAEGTLWCLVAADAGRAVLRRIAAKRANVVLLNIFIS